MKICECALPEVERTYDRRVDEFVPLIGEPLAIDLVNTRLPVRWLGPVDALESLTGLRSWIERQPDIRTVARSRLTAADLAAVHTLRQHVTSAVHRARQGKQPTTASMRGINRVLVDSPVHPRLTWKGDALVLEAIHPRAAGPALLARLARAAAELLSDPRVRTIRDCEMSDCQVLFYPTNPRRKWCADEICGNRARVARHYRKKHSTPHQSV